MAPSNGLSKEDNVEVSEASEASEADLAQALRDLERGEQTAARLESNLTNLEKKIDDLLASFEESERLKVEEANGEEGTHAGGEHGGDEVAKS